MKSSTVPILEFDPRREAMIEPSRVVHPRDVPEHCVLCFFGEVLEKVIAERGARVVAEARWEDAVHLLYEIEHGGQRLAFIHPAVGAPLAAGILEEIIARGCRKFIVCGSCGVLQENMALGHLVVVSSAVRDEGLSYHYLPASREVTADPIAVDILEETLKERGLPFITGKTWTTDAPYRETPAKVALRRSEGCITVEMEAAALMAVAQFRSVVLGQLLYGGDDLSSDTWDERGWHTRTDIRESLFWLAAGACLRL